MKENIKNLEKTSKNKKDNIKNSRKWAWFISRNVIIKTK